MRRVSSALVLAVMASGAQGASSGNVTARTLDRATLADTTQPLLVPPKAKRASASQPVDNIHNPDPSLSYNHYVAPIIISGGPVNLSEIARISARWGRVTSTLRSVEHNRSVGGVANSYHLSGRAIDIARRPGVVHAQIAAALRAAGYALLESLDEGDHSHFAFGGAGEIKVAPRPERPRVTFAGAGDPAEWQLVYASGAGR